MHVIEIKDVNGNVVRVYETDALAAIGDTLFDGEKLYVPRSKDSMYVCARLVDNSEVPG